MINNNLENNNLNNKYYVFDKETYRIIKYIKQSINNENCCDLGKYRSVILKDNVLKVFSPPKSLNLDVFINSNNFDIFIDFGNSIFIQISIKKSNFFGFKTSRRI